MMMADSGNDAVAFFLFFLLALSRSTGKFAPIGQILSSARAFVPDCLGPPIAA